MPTRFKHYLPLSEDKKKDIWANGIIVLDTNIWLHLYRMPSKQRNDFLRILNDVTIIDRLWVPHQVAEEFFRNRLEVIFDQVRTADEVTEKLEKLIESEFQKVFNKIGQYHPIIDRKAWKDAFHKTFIRLRKKSEKNKVGYNFSFDNDELLPRILNLFEGSVGDPLPNVEDVVREADKRFKEGIPPGFCDSKKDGPDKGYGDFFIWKQLLEKTSKSKQHTVFVTDDMKVDWWLKTHGQSLGPVPYLRKEYADLTDHEFVITSSKRFLECADASTIGLEHDDIDLLSDAFLQSQMQAPDRPTPLTRVPENPTATDIVDWINGNFDDPVHGVPYETREGGYQFIYGGDRELPDVIDEYFGDVDQSVRDEALHELGDLGDIVVRKGLY